MDSGCLRNQFSLICFDNGIHLIVLLFLKDFKFTHITMAKKKTSSEIVRQKFADYLKEGEQIIWSSKITTNVKDTISVQYQQIMMALLLFGIGFFWYFGDPGLVIFYPILIIGMLVTGYYGGLFNFSIPDNSQKTINNYTVFTNFGCLQLSNEFTRIPYQQFYHLEVKKIQNKQQVILIASPDKKSGFEKDLIVRGNYDAEKLYQLILPHWKAMNPNKKILETTKQLCSTYGLKERINKSGISTFVGRYNNFVITASWRNSIPISTISIQLTCPNPTDSYFSFSEENPSTNLKKLAGKKEHETGEQAFDDTFFLEVDNKDLALQLFDQSARPLMSKSIQQLMAACIKKATCSWTLGQPTIVPEKIKLKKSSFKDQMDILDFQLLKSDDKETLPSTTMTVDWKEGNVSSLRFFAAVHDQERLRPERLADLLEDCMESVVALAEGVEGYHGGIKQE